MGAFWALLVSVLIAWFTKGSGLPVGGKNETSGNGTQLIGRGSFSYIDSDVGRNGANGSNILESLLYGGYGSSDGFADHNGTVGRVDDHAAHNGTLVASNKGATGSINGLLDFYLNGSYDRFGGFGGFLLRHEEQKADLNGTVAADHAADNVTLVASNGGNKGATGSGDGILRSYPYAAYGRSGGFADHNGTVAADHAAHNGTLVASNKGATGSGDGILDNYLNGSYDRFGGFGGFRSRPEEQKAGLNGTLTPTTTLAVAAV